MNCIYVEMENVWLSFNRVPNNIIYLILNQLQSQQLDGIQNMVQLRNLTIEYSKIYSIYPLKFLINLEKLNLRGNQIVVIQYIFDLPKLKQIDISFNSIPEDQFYKIQYQDENKYYDYEDTIKYQRSLSDREQYIYNNEIAVIDVQELLDKVNHDQNIKTLKNGKEKVLNDLIQFVEKFNRQMSHITFDECYADQ
ncbi:Leucine_rich repeat 4 [Hexamita inflata]|uniref:Leucine rich repeat 4 n=1 Tax=Hexamita inflata TaxID=28002 RepID=A0AA86QAW6_9EUKA|nr:Leucine rich repeat 4 [Hexamita inflata]